MKIAAINGSPRKNGNTARCLEAAGKEIQAAGVDFRVFQPGAKVLRETKLPAPEEAQRPMMNFIR